MAEILTSSEQVGKGAPRASDRIFRLWPVLEITVLVAMIVLFNFYTDRIGVYRQAFDPDTFTPVLGERFRSFLPILNLWWSLSLVLAFAKLIQGRWTAVTRWADIAVNLFGISVLLRLLVGGPVLQVGSALDIQLGNSIVSLNWPAFIPDTAVTLERLVFGLAILGNSLDVLKKLIKLIALDPDTGRFRYALYELPKQE
jgi:hypothetical protein